MYVAAGKWDEAHKLSNKYMQKEDVSDMYLDKVLTLGGGAAAAVEIRPPGGGRDAELLFGVGGPS